MSQNIPIPVALSRGIKQQGKEADHLPPFSAEFKKYVSKTPRSYLSSWLSAQLIKHKDNFILLYTYITLYAVTNFN
jgi:hypothetical protein